MSFLILIFFPDKIAKGLFYRGNKSKIYLYKLHFLLKVILLISQANKHHEYSKSSKVNKTCFSFPA